jgi:hypothetical protein
MTYSTAVCVDADTATLSNVTSANTSGTLLAANPSRVAAYVYNDSSAVLYLAFSSTAASTSNYTVQLAANAYYEFPQPIYTGIVLAIWASANGNARVTEMVS